MFKGRFYYTIDEKGRIMIPVRFREIIEEEHGGRVVITNFDKCLVLYPLKEWNELEKKLLSLPSMKKSVTVFLRFVVSSATECQMDRQGRILIPQALREFAKLEKEIVIAGAINKLEIWAKDIWIEEYRKAMEEFDTIREELSNLGL